jgi:hypothetical protein
VQNSWEIEKSGMAGIDKSPTIIFGKYRRNDRKRKMEYTTAALSDDLPGGLRCARSQRGS